MERLELELRTCRVTINGCTDSNADNYRSTANADDGSCFYAIWGCMVSANTLNYDSTATSNSGCEYTYRGCTDSLAANFNPKDRKSHTSELQSLAGSRMPSSA